MQFWWDATDRVYIVLLNLNYILLTHPQTITLRKPDSNFIFTFIQQIVFFETKKTVMLAKRSNLIRTRQGHRNHWRIPSVPNIHPNFRPTFCHVIKSKLFDWLIDWCIIMFVRNVCTCVYVYGNNVIHSAYFATRGVFRSIIMFETIDEKWKQVIQFETICGTKFVWLENKRHFMFCWQRFQSVRGNSILICLE